MRWCLFYADGRVFTSNDGEPGESPEYGLVGILQAHYQGTKTLHGDYFAFYEGRWWNHDLEGLLTELCHDARRFQCVRRGKYADDSTYLEITTRMEHDRKHLIWQHRQH